MLYGSTYMKYLEYSNSETESIVIVRGWVEGRMRSYWLMGTEFQFCKMKRVLEIDGGDGCTTV